MSISKPSVLLRGMNKSNKSPNTPGTVSYEKRRKLKDGEQVVHRAALIHMREELNSLSTGYDPAIHRVVDNYLHKAGVADTAMLEAWRKVGREDRRRSREMHLTDAVKRTVSPLGIACLIRYCQGWIDQAEALALEEEKSARRSKTDDA